MSQFLRSTKGFAITARLGGLNWRAKVNHQPEVGSIDQRLQLVEKEVQAIWAPPKVRIAKPTLVQNSTVGPKHSAINRPKKYLVAKEWVTEVILLQANLRFQRPGLHPPVVHFPLPYLHLLAIDSNDFGGSSHAHIQKFEPPLGRSGERLRTSFKVVPHPSNYSACGIQEYLSSMCRGRVVQSYGSRCKCIHRIFCSILHNGCRASLSYYQFLLSALR